MKFNRIYIEVTNICGLECSFCPTKNASSQSMEFDFFRDIVAQCKSYTDEIVFHVMGDPLVLSNIEQYLDIVASASMKAMVTTSGFYISSHQPKAIFHPALRQLNISLNSFNKNNTKLTLNEYLEPILSLCEAKLAHYPSPFVNLRLWNIDSNQSEQEFNNLVLEKLANFFQLDVMGLVQGKRVRLAPKILLDFDEYFEWPSMDNRVYGDGYCGGLDSHIAVLCDGTVVPCCLDFKGVIPLGDLKCQSLDEILCTKRAIAIKNGFACGVAIEELCQKCSYKMRFN